MSHTMPREQARQTGMATLTPTLPVLIVDDEIPIIELLRDILEDEGLSVLTASDGRAALMIVQRTAVGLVLTDLMMPYLNGIEMAQQLRHDPHTAHIPILLMSAAPPAEVSDLFAALIRKPFALDEVVDTVRNWLLTTTPPAGTADAASQ